ncbi:cation diffusion facilitator family transporter [Ferruginibacter sp. SUN002]|uniref:cation diffusion facilitator family transporter n=1 Tax=Ferruginibacter sp. SUN002 TaxID=2937789 RepID=UPI003D360BD2
MQKKLQNLRLQKIIAIVAIVLFIMKVIAWYLTRSVAILTDALESIVNVTAGLIGVYSLYISAKPKDNDHPYGHGKVEFISAAVEGTLITVAGVIIIYEAINNFIHPHQIKQLDWGIMLVAATAVINYLVGIICVTTGKKNNSLVLISSGKHLQTDTYSTLGIIVGLILLYFLKFWWIDGVVAIIFAFIIIFTGYKIVRTSVAGIMDEADTELVEKMVTLLNANRREDWIDCHNLRIIKNGPTLHLDCHLTLPWYMNMHEAHHEIDGLSNLVKTEFGDSMELFVHTDGCLEFSCAICSKQNCNVRKHAFERKVDWTFENITTDSKHRL